jgi:hypothetical protein
VGWIVMFDRDPSVFDALHRDDVLRVLVGVFDCDDGKVDEALPYPLINLRSESFHVIRRHALLKSQSIVDWHVALPYPIEPTDRSETALSAGKHVLEVV